MEEELNYQLGTYVGKLIVDEHLLTLSTDSLKTNNVITVSEKETEIWRIKDAEWFSLSMLSPREKELFGDESSKIFYENLKWYVANLKNKYLPETLSFLIPKVVPTNLTEFKKGIDDTIWNCDRSHYILTDDFLQQNEYGTHSIITLKRDITTIPDAYL